MLRAKHMGFKSVRRVEVKAETTTPGEVRTMTDASGARVSASRGRRTLPKLEFTVDEDGAVLHGPQRGAYPFFSSAALSATNPPVGAGVDAASVERELAASFQALHMREFPAAATDENDQAARRLSSNQNDSTGGADGEEEDGDVGHGPDSQEAKERPAPPMKECILNDTRATTLAVKYDRSVGKFVCGSSIERFSGHTGVCRVLGSKKYPIIPHSLRIGDLLRIGSVGLVVCELNRTASDDTLEALSEEEYEFLKENYLSLPLQQTFHPTDSRGNHLDEDEDGNEDDDKEDCARTRRVGGETSDEGESEEDARAGRDSANGSGLNGAATNGVRTLGVSGMAGKRFCYICYDGDDEPEENPLVAPCNCKGDTKYVHLDCLQRWNNNLDADGSNPNQKVCAVTNTDGLDVCSICKATYLTSVRLDDGRVVSLLAKKLPPPYVTFAVVTQHETRNRSTALTNTRFQLSFANLPRGQQYLTIGRSTTNNMTLRYRTVSQLHAKVKFQDGHFFLCDASSSNGTMLFLSKPLELDWNKTMHVKIGRTILTLKSKKKWKWTGAAEDGADSDGGEDVTSPRVSGTGSPREGEDLTPRTHFANSFGTSTTPRRPGLNRFESDGVLSDPSAELLSSPFRGPMGAFPTGLNNGYQLNSGSQTTAGHIMQTPLSRSTPAAEDMELPESFNLSEIDDDAHDSPSRGNQEVDDRTSFATAYRPFLPGNLRPNFADASGSTASPAPLGFLQGRAADLPRMRNELRQRRDHALFDLVESLARVDAAAAPARDSPSSPRGGSSPLVAASLSEQD